MTDRRTEVLADATRQRTYRAEKAVEKALAQARNTGGPVTIAGIAASAGVSSDFIYRHPTLRPRVEALRRANSPARTGVDIPADAHAAESTLVRRLTHQLATVRRQHQQQVAELRAALEAAHGELLLLRRSRDDQ
ncbi:hypothetical protein OHB12_11605 [Nocardia sp. NBC_01730]|uniref:hypothetical protein n=1 Tax=Nocardia sp. NBC_01730 TaxID=2975998 RepID=UPI002E12F9DE|nr:hypothetical protein OHB12_11605 [Nocardia sp. NBC_01730]